MHELYTLGSFYALSICIHAAHEHAHKLKPDPSHRHRFGTFGAVLGTFAADPTTIHTAEIYAIDWLAKVLSHG